MRVVIAGGGIGGLTVAALLRRSILKSNRIGSIHVFERSKTTHADPLGGGIGLWPPSLRVLTEIGIPNDLEKNGHYMSQVSYLDHKGNVLAAPTEGFGQKFPVLCLQRQVLHHELTKACLQPFENIPPVNIEYGNEVTAFEVMKDGVSIQTAERRLTAELLIGADGIHSMVRRHIAPHLEPVSLGYVYYRAIVQSEDRAMWLAAFESWGHNGARFGYVPLAFNQLFWFVAVPQDALQDCNEPPPNTAMGVAEHAKLQLVALLKGWAGHPAMPLAPDDIVRQTPAHCILRTPIAKIPANRDVPWFDRSGRVILLGDAIHATAPNLAQGAGLALEDASDLTALLLHAPTLSLPCLASQYQRLRLPRAQTVQRYADLVAMIGQSRGAAHARDLVMAAIHRVFPRLQQIVFERIVSNTLGGTSRSLTWTPTSQSPLERALGLYGARSLAPPFARRLQLNMEGTGTASVDTSSGGVLARGIARTSGLPRTNPHVTFRGVSTWCPRAHSQHWTRTFGSDTYTTEMTSVRVVRAQTGAVLLESVVGPHVPLLNKLRIGYTVSVSKEGTQLHYCSEGLWVGNVRIPLPRILKLESSWTETLTHEGWTFDGLIRLPPLLGAGALIQYSGNFILNKTT